MNFISSQASVSLTDIFEMRSTQGRNIDEDTDSLNDFVILDSPPLFVAQTPPLDQQVTRRENALS